MNLSSLGPRPIAALFALGPSSGGDFGLDAETLLSILGLMVITLVLTGPGLWSEHWGWGFLEKWFGKKKPPPKP